jgi:hypothetical protein
MLVIWPAQPDVDRSCWPTITSSSFPSTAQITARLNRRPRSWDPVADLRVLGQSVRRVA